MNLDVVVMPDPCRTVLLIACMTGSMVGSIYMVLAVLIGGVAGMLIGATGVLLIFVGLTGLAVLWREACRGESMDSAGQGC